MFRAVSVILVLVATSVVLGSTIGWPSLPTLPSRHDIREGLSSSYLSIDVILTAFGFVAWLLWIYIVLVTALRIVVAIATRLALPGAGGLQTFSDRVTPFVLRRVLDVALGGALLVSTMGGPRFASAHETIPASYVVQSVVGNGHKIEPLAGIHNSPSSVQFYVVRRGDSLWGIAERELGSGLRWREIYDLNVGKAQPDGRKLNRPRLIRPGWQLLIPSEAQKQPVQPPAKALDPIGDVPNQTPPAPTPPARADKKEQPTQVVVSRPIKVDLPNGAVVPASFAAGALAASLAGKLRRRHRRRVGDMTLPTPPEVVARAAARAGIDPSVDVIGSQSEVVIRAWHEAVGSVPTFLATWEEPHTTTFLIFESPERLPPSFETAMGQHVAFELEGSHTRARISGPTVPRLRRSPYATADGGLVPVGFGDEGVLHLPLLGFPLLVSGSGDESLVEAVQNFARMRLGDGSLEVWTPDEGADLSLGLRQKIELEALRRRRLFAEEGVSGFLDHALMNPDEQLPIILLLLDKQSVESISDVLSILISVGMGIMIIGEVEIAGTRIRCEEVLEVRIESLDQITVEPASLSASETTPPNEFELHPEPKSETPEAEDSSYIADDERPHTSAPQDLSDRPRRICALGGFRVEVDGEMQEKGWRSPALEILAALIAYPKGLSRDKLVSMVWPDSEFSDVERLFYTSVSQIRSNLRRADETTKIIESSRVEDAYRLDLNQVWVDVAAFREHLLAAQASSDAETHLRRALDLYQGDFLGEKYYPWAEQVREQLRDMFDDALATLSGLLEKRADFVSALQLIDRALEHNPLSEDLCERAMNLEARLGRRQGIIDRFQRLKTALAGELEIEPSEQIQDLFNSLVSQPRAVQRS